MVKNLPANAVDARDVGLVPGSGRSLGEGNGNPLQYSYLGNPMDRGVWWATVHGVSKSWTRLNLADKVPETAGLCVLDIKGSKRKLELKLQYFGHPM